MKSIRYCVDHGVYQRNIFNKYQRICTAYVDKPLYGGHVKVLCRKKLLKFDVKHDKYIPDTILRDLLLRIYALEKWDDLKLLLIGKKL